MLTNGNGNVYGYLRLVPGDPFAEQVRERFRELGIGERNLYVDEADPNGEGERPAYERLKQAVRPGDLVYLDRMASLGMEYERFAREWKAFTRELGAAIVILEDEHLFDSRKFDRMGFRRDLMEEQFLSVLFYPV